MGNALRLVPPDMDVTAAIETIVREHLPVDTIVIDVCHGGQAIFPLGTQLPPRRPADESPFDELPDEQLTPLESPFAVRPGFEGGTQLREWIALAHGAGLRVYAGMNLLRWWTPHSSDADPFIARPELVELDSKRSCEGTSTARYATPWSPVVRQGVESLLEALGAEYPELDGLYVECRFPRTSWMGFSDQARIAYIRYASVDPADLPVYGVDEGDDPELRAWMVWRLSEFRSLLNCAVAAFRRGTGDVGRPAVARVTCGIAARRLRFKAVSGEDWVMWLVAKTVDDVVLEVDLNRERARREHQAGLRLYADACPSGQATTLISGELWDEPLPLDEAYSRVTEMGLGGGCVLVDPAQAAQMETAWAVLRALPRTGDDDDPGTGGV